MAARVMRSRFAGLRNQRLDAVLWALPILLWLGIFFVGALIFLLITSFQTSTNYQTLPIWTLDNYKNLAIKPDIYKSLANTLWFAASTALLTIAIVYPFAYALAFKIPPRWRLLCIGLTITPFFASYLMRAFTWTLLLGQSGIINGLLLDMGLIGKPLKLLYTQLSIRIGILSFLIPLCTLLLYLSLARVNRTLLEAASNLGARPWWSFLTVTVPLAKNGLVLSGLLAFVLSFGDFISPAVLGGGRIRVLSLTMFDLTKLAGNWAQASAVGVMMIVILLVIIMVIFKATAGRQRL